MPLQDLRDGHLPSFVKSLLPKLFRAGVYASLAELSAVVKGLDDKTQLIVSGVVELEAEARCWILDGEVTTAAIYEDSGDLQAAQSFASEVARSAPLAETCVLDVGFIRGHGWAVVEANAAWGSGLNGCDPLAAARCVARACSPRS